MKNSILKLATISIALCGFYAKSNANEELYINRIYEAAARFAKRTPSCSEQLKQVAAMSNKSYAEKRGFYNNISKDTKREISIGLAEMFFDESHQDPVRVHVDIAKYMANTGVQVDAHYKNIVTELDKIKNANMKVIMVKLFSMRALINKIPKREKDIIDRELNRLKQEKGISESKATQIFSKKLGGN